VIFIIIKFKYSSKSHPFRLNFSLNLQKFLNLHYAKSLTFDPHLIDLPVVDIIKEVKSYLESNNTLIVNAPPGAGKSTLLPLVLIEEPWLQGKKILILEPRRLAARSIAERMSFLLKETVGETVGYRIRFDTKVGPKTKIEVLTEGILTRMLHSDNALTEVGLVIFDEFHERSIHADVAMALCREAQLILRPDLRIMVMSATLDMPQLSSLLKAPVAVSTGRQFPVELFYVGDTDERMMSEMAAQTIMMAVKTHPGDVLAFFPGQGEIKKCEEILKTKLKGFEIHPLYGQLPHAAQRAALFPDKKGRRKIVLATSIAETSLTIEGIQIVVDTGFGRNSKFDPKSGLSRLETIAISKDAADQRAGRAGRLSAGVCFRMWSAVTQSRMLEHRIPEIQEADLAPLVLDMAEWNILDAHQLTWLTPPPKGTLAQASDLLHQLDALENGRITAHGKRIHQLPCQPRIAHMLLFAQKNEALPLGADIAALLEERDPLTREAGIDINLRIEALRRFRYLGNEGNRFGRINKIAKSYAQLFDIPLDQEAFDPYETGILIAQAYPERIACARPGNNAQFQLSNGRYATAGHKDDLANEPWLAVATMDARDGMGKIFLAAPLNPKDLAPLVREKEVITWDTENGGLIATKDLRIGNIVLKSTPLPDPNEKHLLSAISNAIKKEGQQLLNFDEEVIQWQNRIMSLRKWRPEQNWPDVSISTLLMTNAEWLSPYLSGIKKPADLKKIKIHEILTYHLPPIQQALLASLTPEKITVPSGSSIGLKYQSSGESPILAVRLQELFGLRKSPVVNDGATKIVLHLLSPGYKPVQVTSDLNSFWKNAYFEVRKELKRRYPKHSWPDDPLSETPISGARPRKK
jgi:ATP-dependent helicase HrpB